MMHGDPMLRRRIAVLGSRAVGKSSLVMQFVDNQFVDNYFPTIESTHTKGIKYNGVTYDCEIIDTAGQDEHSVLNSRLGFGIHGYILVYSVDDRNSFEMIPIVHDKILENSGETKFPCIIVGQKSDLTDASTQTLRRVQTAEAQKLAQSINAQFVETSARTNTNVGKVFDMLLGEIEKSNNPNPEQGGKCIIM